MHTLVDTLSQVHQGSGLFNHVKDLNVGKVVVFHCNFKRSQYEHSS